MDTSSSHPDRPDTHDERAAERDDARAKLDEIRGVLVNWSEHDAIRAIVERPAAAPTRTSRELLGYWVRQVWIEWAREQDDPKQSWLTPWEDLDDGQREVDMRIGEALFSMGQHVADPKRFFTAAAAPGPIVAVGEEPLEPLASTATVARKRTFTPAAYCDRCGPDQEQESLAAAGWPPESVDLPAPGDHT